MESDEDDPFSSDDEAFLALANRPRGQSTQAYIQTQIALRKQQTQPQTPQQHVQQQRPQQMHQLIAPSDPAPIITTQSPQLNPGPIRPNIEGQGSKSPPIPTQNDLEFRSAGQLALLKAKNDQLEREKTQISEKLKRDFDQKSLDQNDLIKKLQDTIRKLEVEQKFQATEIREYKAKIKRRRLDENQRGTDVVMTDVSGTTPPLSKTAQPIQNQQVQAQLPPRHQVHPAVPVLQQRLSKPKGLPNRSQSSKNLEDNTLFIDRLLCYCIPGVDIPVMTFLDKIAISEKEFKTADFRSAPGESLKSSLLSYLSAYKTAEGIDSLISRLLKAIVEIIMFLLIDVQVIKDFTEQRSDLKHNRHKLLAIPFLLAIIHGCLTYRPKAINQIQQVFTLINFSLMLMDKYNFLIEPVLKTNEFYDRNVKLKLKSIQYEFLESLIVIYSLDLIEVLIMNCVHVPDKKKAMKEYLTHNKNRLLRLFQLVLSNFNHSSVNLMFSVVSILNATLNLWETDQEEEFPLTDNAILKSIIALATADDFEPRANWLVYGLNRSIGNNLDAELIADLVPDQIDLPFQVRPVCSKAHNKEQVAHNHQLHHTALSVLILQFCEKLILFDYQNEHSNTLTFLAKEPSVFKNLIMNMSKIQQFNFLHPRRRDHLNMKVTEVLSYSLKIIHLVKELYRLTPSDSQDTSEFNFTSDLSFELFVILSRISIPSKEDTTDPSTLFLLQYQQECPEMSRYFLTKLPNTRNLTTLNLTDPNEVQPMAQVLSNTPNGLEIPYDSETIDLAREILNNLVTADEADMFYSAMRLAEVSLDETPSSVRI